MPYPRLTDEPGAAALAAAIRARKLSPVDAVEQAIARIEDLDAPINAIAVADFDRARAAARAMSAGARAASSRRTWSQVISR